MEYQLIKEQKNLEMIMHHRPAFVQFCCCCCQKS